MRGWITGGNGTCGLQLGADDSLELVERTREIVVHNLVPELGFERQLPFRHVQALVDLPLAFGRTGAKAPLELLLAGSGHEDGHRGRDPVAHGERAAGLD